MDCKEQRSGEAASTASIDAPLPNGETKELTPDDAKPACFNLAMDSTTINLQSETIRKVLSNCYGNVVERLSIKYPPRCARNLNYCYQHHINANLPNAPTYAQICSLQNALMDKHYLDFIESVKVCCSMNLFPGDGVFKKIIDAILVLLPKNLDAKVFQMTYVELIESFRLMVYVFPPCWLALRIYYENLLETPIVTKEGKGKKGKQNYKLKFNQKIVPLLLKLLENSITECSKDELSQQTNLHTVVEDALVEDKCNKSNEDNDKLPTLPTFDTTNPCYWDYNQICLDNFYLLSTSDRISRLFDVLELLLYVLEIDCCMWLQRLFEDIPQLIFDPNKCPLIVLVCELKEQHRNTEVVDQLFKLFALASAKGLHKKRLIVIERYISLLFEISNTADLEFRGACCKYPSLSERTKNLINNFFVTFKAYNPSHINNYIQAITLISQPYVRYQFIDHFLQMFHFSKTEQLTPQKIAYDLIQRKTWRKYKPRGVISSSNKDDISREDYLDLLLNALRAYCKWHGWDLLVNSILHNRDIKPLQTVAESTDRQRENQRNRINIPQIETELDTILHNLNVHSLVSKKKVDLPLMKINVDAEILKQYQIDLKFLLSLAEQLPKEAEASMQSQVDFSAWLKFLKPFQV